MAGGVNKVILIGNLGGDPELRYTPGGVPVANINIATSESWKNKSGPQPPGSPTSADVALDGVEVPSAASYSLVRPGKRF